MSLTARLHIVGHSSEDQGIPVLACDFGFSQDYNGTVGTFSNITASTIDLTIRGLDDEELFSWMLTPRSLRSGRISFSGITSTGPGRRIEFEDGVLVGYHESFTNESDIIISLVISVRKLSLFGVEHENHWTAAEGA
jgi:hypothetical protein